MYVGADFPDTTPLEVRRLAFDFSDALGQGEVINSSVWAIAVAANSSVQDPSPSSRLVGSPIHNTPQDQQQIGGCLNGVRYLVTCLITTSLGAQIEFSSYILCVAPA